MKSQPTDFAATATRLRVAAGLSQQQLAQHLGVARATYASLESGRREPNLREIRELSRIYQISPDRLINVPAADYVEEPKPIYAPAKQPEFMPEKFRDTLLYITAAIGARPHVGETVLQYLLYMIDTDYYGVHAEAITGLFYRRGHYGPQPSDDFADTVGKMRADGSLAVVETPLHTHLQCKYLPLVVPKLDALSASELAHTESSLARYGDYDVEALSQIIQQTPAWRATNESEVIYYRMP